MQLLLRRSKALSWGTGIPGGRRQAFIHSSSAAASTMAQHVLSELNDRLGISDGSMQDFFTFDVSPLQKAFMALAAKVRAGWWCTHETATLALLRGAQSPGCDEKRWSTCIPSRHLQVEQCQKENVSLRAELAELKVCAPIVYRRGGGGN